MAASVTRMPDVSFHFPLTESLMNRFENDDGLTWNQTCGVANGKLHEEEEADNWKGLSDKAERRKRQNRLHQRAWRRRKALEASEAALAASNEVWTPWI